nr:Smr/MutS family protein [Rhodoblastus acidophilus]
MRLLSREELALWRHVVADVVPRAGRKRMLGEDLAPARPPTPSPASPMAPPIVPAKPARREPPPLAPLEPKLRRRLASGREAIEDRLDLHGMTQAQAHSALIGFVHRAHARETRIVLVITGKGGGDFGERGVLRRVVPLWLREPALRALVSSVEEAARPHGGAGAFYVRLRRRRPG